MLLNCTSYIIIEISGQGVHEAEAAAVVLVRVAADLPIARAADRAAVPTGPQLPTHPSTRFMLIHDLSELTLLKKHKAKMAMVY